MGGKRLSPSVINGKQYWRIGLIGKGGTSRVFRVLDNLGGTNAAMYAMKRVELHRSDTESYESFLNEIKLLERLKGNARVIKLVDSQIDHNKNQLFLLMELGETDLNGLLIEQMGKPISLNFIRYIWEQMLQCVSVVHEANIVHSDLKPANFVLVKGNLKLIDFGISKAIPNDTTNIGREQQIGTANYMSPEALYDSGKGSDGKRLMKLGRPSDVWSLGCILYQMVYGRTPFSHIKNVSQKIVAIQNEKHVIDFPRESVPLNEKGEPNLALKVVLEPELIDTLRSCFEFLPKQRATIPELLQAPFLRGTSADSSGSPSPLKAGVFI
ncbi:kinase-like protein [Atractiella rhizophila]|nr:kinase-like protein [Atractiella rhizophila]